MKRLLALLSFAMVVTGGSAWGASKYVTMREVNAGGVGEIIGIIEFKDTAKGLKVIPNLRGLSEGQHGTHVHQNPSCDPAEKDGKMVPGLGAGGHFDPDNTGVHQGPQGQGHLGDLAVLYVDEQLCAALENHGFGRPRRRHPQRRRQLLRRSEKARRRRLEGRLRHDRQLRFSGRAPGSWITV
jgi:Cu/Zn superoxide dismutase